MDEILPGLQSADGLQFLKLGGNPIPSDVLDSLLGAVTGMRNLKVLDLEGLWVKKSFMQVWLIKLMNDECIGCVHSRTGIP